MMADSRFIITPSPSRQQFTLWRDARLDKFCQAWRQHSSLNTPIDLQNANCATIW